MTILTMSSRIPKAVALLLLLLMSSFPLARGANVTVASREAITSSQLIDLNKNSFVATHELALTVAYFPAAGWQRDTLLAAVKAATQVLGQCGVRLATVELVALDADRYFQDFSTPASRELARRVPLRRPTLYFVADTLQQPAFEAEAIGRGNSRTRPELADTVWVTRGARDLELVVAHELAHVLMDSGAHSTLPRNLMRENTAPGNVELDAAQCARLQDSATRHGLLTPRT